MGLTRARVVASVCVLGAAASLAACDAILGIGNLPPIDASADGIATDATTDARLDAASDVVATDANDASDASDGGCDADFATSPTSCGRCGHDCLGGACVDGGCQAVTVQSDVRPTGITTDTNNVYWVTWTGAVRACPQSGCDAGLTTYATNQAYVYDVAVDNSNVYWAVNTDSVGAGHVGSCAKSGCDGGTPNVLVSTAPNLNPAGIAVNGQTLYFTSQPANVYTCATSGCNDTPSLFATYPTSVLADSLAFDTTSAYWTASINVYKCNTSGCNTAPTAINTSQGYAGSIAFYGGNLYWADNTASETTGAIVTCAPGNCLNATTLASNRVGPFAIAVDASGIYWLERGTLAQQYADGGVYFCPLTGCGSGPVKLAGRDDQNISMAHYIALDAVSAFWTEGWNNGAVRRVAKP